MIGGREAGGGAGGAAGVVGVADVVADGLAAEGLVEALAGVFAAGLGLDAGCGGVGPAGTAAPAVQPVRARIANPAALAVRYESRGVIHPPGPTLRRA